MKAVEGGMQSNVTLGGRDCDVSRFFEELERAIPLDDVETTTERIMASDTPLTFQRQCYSFSVMLRGNRDNHISGQKPPAASQNSVRPLSRIFFTPDHACYLSRSRYTYDTLCAADLSGRLVCAPQEI